MKNIILIASLALNIGLGICCWLSNRPKPSPDTFTVNSSTVDYNIRSRKNFESVYFNRNDSLYKVLWNEAFENEPEQSVLIACSYYYVTKDTSMLKYIEMSTEQMETIYSRKLRIGAHSTADTSKRH